MFSIVATVHLLELKCSRFELACLNTMAHPSWNLGTVQAKDTAFWAGHYGGKFMAPQLCFAGPDDRQLTSDE